MAGLILAFEEYMAELVAQGLATQWERIKQEWEPQVAAVLTSAAEASLKVLRTEVAVHLARPWPRRDLGGLKPRLEKADPDPEREIRHLAALPLLERSMAAGLLAFTREVVTILQENKFQPLEPTELDHRMAQAGRKWRNRLAATSATLVMAVAGSARGAVRAALR